MIYKYDLGKPNNHGDYPTAIITHGEIIKKFLDIQLQDGNAVIWAEVEKANVGNNYIIVKAIWTGFEEPANMIYIGTLQEPQYGTVYHYYAEDPRGKKYEKM
jgi:hypothetical protein